MSSPHYSSSCSYAFIGPATMNNPDKNHRRSKSESRSVLCCCSYFRTIVFDRVGAKEGEEAEDVVRRRETKGLLNPA